MFNYYKSWSLFLFFLGLSLIMTGFMFLFNMYSFLLDWEILSLNSVCLCMSMYFDWMSLLFMGSVMLISSMVVFYSDSYMHSDVFKIRFLFLVLLFVLSMMFLIISPNLISILLGWDGLGLVSYCLVIYYQNFKSYNAGMLTILSNRIGDVSILIGIAWLFNMGSWNFIYYMNFMDSYISYWLLNLLVLAAFTKSAQIPFSSWLPAAMAAPTPVSALVHSSTLVTAGVYLLIRFSELLYNYNLDYFLLISCLTMFMSGLSANFEYDLKKIIALSTLSQLGLMMSMLFMGYSVYAYYHMLTHAFFKALMFLCAGLIIHSMNDSQDIRHMGNLINYIPFTCSCFCISNLSLCGFPFLSGFYSKDLVLEYLTFNYYNFYIFIMFYLSVGLTVCYSLRLIYFCFKGSSGLSVALNYSEDKTMMYSLILLTMLSIFSGSLLNWLIFPYPLHMVFPPVLKILPLIFVFLGGWLGYSMSFLSVYNFIFGLSYNYMVEFLGSMWFMPSFSTYMVSEKFLSYSKMSSLFMDHKWGEYFVSGSLSNLINYSSSFYLNYQFNSVKVYLISFVFMFFFLILILK
uniref:NADH-ubiquinone oxidoreductase chain 5 n=1 Tax=Plautia crossota TaxID=355527 RepID=A0A7T8G462_9HEMI|nr:NADH dehydrogenase subunit 5 [Plautia crossota]QQP22170.1 NADH dehydrogenase subunit 5 [Plautia crossota]